MRPGARFGIAVAIVGEVSVIPFSSKDWNTATLGGKNRGHRSHMFNYEVILIILIKSKHNAKTAIQYTRDILCKCICIIGKEMKN